MPTFILLSIITHSYSFSLLSPPPPPLFFLFSHLFHFLLPFHSSPFYNFSLFSFFHFWSVFLSLSVIYSKIFTFLFCVRARLCACFCECHFSKFFHFRVQLIGYRSHSLFQVVSPRGISFVSPRGLSCLTTWFPVSPRGFLSHHVVSLLFHLVVSFESLRDFFVTRFF